MTFLFVGNIGPQHFFRWPKNIWVRCPHNRIRLPGADDVPRPVTGVVENTYSTASRRRWCRSAARLLAEIPIRSKRR